MQNIQDTLGEISDVIEKMKREIDPDTLDQHDMLDLELQLYKVKSRLQDAFLIALGF